MGATFLVVTLVFIFIILLFTLVLFLIRRYGLSENNKQRLENAKKAIFFNSMIRYAFLSANKLNMSAMLGIKGLEETDASSNIFSVLILIGISALPLLFAGIMYKNARTLESDKSMEKYRAIFSERTVKEGKRIWLYPIVFFLRRAAFITVTVFMFERPEF